VRFGSITVLGATLFACTAGAVPVSASAATGHEATGGATAPSASSVGAAPAPTATTPATTTTPVAPTVQYMGPIVRTASTPSVTTSLSQVSCLIPGTTTSEPCAGSNGTAASATGGSQAGTAGAALQDMIVPGNQAKIVDGLAAAPANAPAAVQDMIWSANAIVGLPYLWGGGHASFVSPAGYDCSGTVSFALHGGSLLNAPLDSTSFESWDAAGRGRWVSVFANGGHAYMVIAGLRLDTSAADDPSNQQGPRWRPLRFDNIGFVVRHPGGY